MSAPPKKSIPIRIGYRIYSILDINTGAGIASVDVRIFASWEENAFESSQPVSVTGGSHSEVREQLHADWYYPLIEISNPDFGS